MAATKKTPYKPQRPMSEYPLQVQRTQRGPELFDACFEEFTTGEGALTPDAAVFYIMHNWPSMVAMMNPGTKMDGPVDSGEPEQE